MISFYSFYTTWAFLLFIASITALSFIVDKYHISGNDECNVNENKLEFDLYSLMIFLLSSTIFTSIIQINGYYSTRYQDSSCKRKFINILCCIIFVVQILGVIMMVHKFDENRDCFDFYKDTINGKVMLISFVGLSIAYILQIIFITIGVISMCCCEKNHYGQYESFR